jgi:hypothetical protein
MHTTSDTKSGMIATWIIAVRLSIVVTVANPSYPSIMNWTSTIFLGFNLSHFFIIVGETPIPKAKRSEIGKLNNPAKRRVIIPGSLLRNLFPKLALWFIPVVHFFALTTNFFKDQEPKDN